MADFPYPFKPQLPMLGTYSSPCIMGDAAAGVLSSTAWPSTNLAVAVPFSLSSPYFVQSVWWINGSTSNGNVDCGVYTSDGTLVFDCGAIAQTGNSLVQAASVSPTVLEPNQYYWALSMSGATATYGGIGSLAAAPQLTGIAQMAGAEPLPASFVFASATSFGSIRLPLFGISSRVATLV